MLVLLFAACLLSVVSTESDVEYNNAINLVRNKYQLSREVSREECPWLESGIPAGTVVYEYIGDTHGAVTKSGVAVTLTPDLDEPFFEVPRSALGPHFQDTAAEDDLFVSRRFNAPIDVSSDDLVSRKTLDEDDDLVSRPKLRRTSRIQSKDCKVDPYSLFSFSEFIVTRDLTKTELPWLNADIKIGERLRAFHGATYGVISPCGVAVTNPVDGSSFIEVPTDALVGLGSDKPDL